MNDIAHAEADAALESMEREISALYDKAVRDMLKKQQTFMDGYEKEYPKMKKLCDEGTLSKSDFIEWTREQAIKERWYGDMTTTLAVHAVNTDQMAASIINGYIPGIYASNFNWGTYTIEHGTGIDTMFTIYDKATVERLIRDNPDLIPSVGLNVTKDANWNRQKFTSAITQGILQGESIDGISARLQNVLKMDENTALRWARTATTAAENGGRADSYKRAEDMGINLKKMWLATLDGRTRDSHRHLDRVSVPLDEAFDNRCEYPGDPGGPIQEIANCRCTMIADMDDVDMSKAHRFSRLKSMSYEEWKEHEGKPVTPEKKQKAKEEAPKRDMRHYTQKELKEFTHDELIEMARAIFIRKNMEAGVPKEEAEHRFRALIGGQSDSYLRRYINKNQ